MLGLANVVVRGTVLALQPDGLVGGEVTGDGIAGSRKSEADNSNWYDYQTTTFSFLLPIRGLTHKGATARLAYYEGVGDVGTRCELL